MGVSYLGSDDRAIGNKFSDQTSERLFSSQNFKVDVCYAADNDSVQTSEFLDEPSFDTYLENNTNTGEIKNTLLFLSQTHSYGKINISKSAFEKLLSTYHISDEVCPFVHSFGAKVRDSDKNFHGYFRHFRETRDQQYLSYEFGFSLRYPERHGRDLEDPWVMRQLLAYQKYDLQSKHSTWMLLQCPSSLRKKLIGLISPEPSYNGSKVQNPLAMHLIILKHCAVGWRDYINHIESIIEELDEKACFSRVGREHQIDFSTTFLDAQLLQQYYCITLKARQAIDSTIDVIEGIKAQDSYLRELYLSCRCVETDITIECLKNQMRMYKRSVITLAECSRGTNTLLLELLSYRNDELSLKHGQLAHQDNEDSKRIATLMQVDAERTRTILEVSMKDSRAIKGLSFIAIIYLPASLVAAFFNSNLLNFGASEGSQNGNANATIISGGFWLYFVVTALLTAITIVFAVLWDRFYVSIARRWNSNLAQP